MVVAVERVPREQIHRYGVIGGEEVAPGVMKVNQLVETPNHWDTDDLQTLEKFFETKVRARRLTVYLSFKLLSRRVVIVLRCCAARWRVRRSRRTRRCRCVASSVSRLASSRTSSDSSSASL